MALIDNTPGKYYRKQLRRKPLLMLKGIKHNMRALLETPVEQQVIFIGGVQRSGTNMLMDVLERSFESDVFLEGDGRAFEYCQMFPIPRIKKLAERSKAPFFIIKALCELQILRELLDEFMPAKAIWPYRDYGDVVNSHVIMWGERMQGHMRAMAGDRNAAGWRGQGMSDETHALVREHYHADISQESACALFWYMRNVLLFEQGLDSDPRVMVYNYSEFVVDPNNSFPQLLAALGMEFTPRLAARVHASSVGKAKQPPIDAGIEELCQAMMKRMDAVPRRWKTAQQ